MRIAMIGAGGFGGYFGARLAQGGADVCFLARGSHLAAIRANGLVVEGGPEKVCVNPVRASDNPADLGVADFVLLAVKLWDTETVLEQIKPMVGPDTTSDFVPKWCAQGQRVTKRLWPGPDHGRGRLRRDHDRSPWRHPADGTNATTDLRRVRWPPVDAR